MRKIALITLIATLLLMFSQSIKAEVKLPAIVSSIWCCNAILLLNFGGWSDAKEKITIASPG